MLPRIAGVLTLPPALLLQHLDGYGHLVARELETSARLLQRRLLLSAVGIGCVLVSTMLVGTAAMLWAATTMHGSTTGGAHGMADGTFASIGATYAWVLVAVPLLPLLVASGSLLMLARSAQEAPFAILRSQLQRDAALLREVAGT